MFEKPFEDAWNLRLRLGAFQDTEALRVFHGPGEGSGVLSRVALDYFAGHYWITFWEDGKSAQQMPSRIADAIKSFLESKNAKSAVLLERPGKGLPETATAFLGSPPDGEFVAKEGAAKFLIRLKDTRHPGLFLDHLPLRGFLSAHSRDRRVLNTFAYTGSLSVAAGLGGAAHVTTLDLSNPTIKWAEANWMVNDLPSSRARFIAGDVFEWLPRLKKNDERFDCVIVDPPSFARGKKGSFSTSKDLPRLHELALDILAVGGTLITSINSADVSWSKYESDIAKAAQVKKARLKVLHKIDLPDTFPTRIGEPEKRYLKGYILLKAPE